jgi:hypothetical protein
MFTMMNSARLAIGIQGVAVGEAAHQKALAYARDRRQGRAVSSEAGASPIVEHPDVQRMLLTQKALTAAARAIAYACAQAIDMGRWTQGDEAKRWQERAGLLTPIAKAFCSDIGVEAASLGIQVHGGMGYIEETGAAVLLRDARIVPIYEGTNGIQAIDLLTRKIGLSGGSAVAELLKDLRVDAEHAKSAESENMVVVGSAVADAIDEAEQTTAELLALYAQNPAEALAVATPYLRLMALTIGGGLLARGCVASLATNDPATEGRIALARYFVDHILNDVHALTEAVAFGGASVLEAAAFL